MGLKDKFSKKDKVKKSKTESVKNELHAEIGEDKTQVVGHAKRVRHLWRSKEIVQLKTDAVAVLWKKRGCAMRRRIECTSLIVTSEKLGDLFAF